MRSYFSSIKPRLQSTSRREKARGLLTQYIINSMLSPEYAKSSRKLLRYYIRSLQTKFSLESCSLREASSKRTSGNRFVCTCERVVCGCGCVRACEEFRVQPLTPFSHQVHQRVLPLCRRKLYRPAEVLSLTARHEGRRLGCRHPTINADHRQDGYEGRSPAHDVGGDIW